MPAATVIPSPAGPIDALWHPPRALQPPQTSQAAVRGSVLCVGGFDGGFDGPAEGIYRDLAEYLPTLGAGVLRLDFRIKASPGPIEAGTADVLAGLEWLSGRGAAPTAARWRPLPMLSRRVQSA